MTPPSVAPLPTAPPAPGGPPAATTLVLRSGTAIDVLGGLDEVVARVTRDPDALVRLESAPFGRTVYVRGDEVAAARACGPGPY